jgi:GT2 family glycosyltransferase
MKTNTKKNRIYRSQGITNRKGNRFSIITCSLNPNKYLKFKNNIEKTFKASVQIINIMNAKSLTEGFNIGYKYAIGEYIIFCHDDIEILNENIESLLKENLQNFDIVGVAGTSKLLQGNWISAGQPYIHGNVAHQINTINGPKYNLCRYSLDSNPRVVKNIQALDGLFIAVRREVMDVVCFDEATFDGFHLYDLDFTYNAFLNGLKTVVDKRIAIIHWSGGNYDENWYKYKGLFENKYKRQLNSNGQYGRQNFESITLDSKEELKTVMQVL